MLTHQFREVGVVDPHNVSFVPKLCLFFVLEELDRGRPRVWKSELDRITPNFPLVGHRVVDIVL